MHLSRRLVEFTLFCDPLIPLHIYQVRECLTDFSDCHIYTLHDKAKTFGHGDPDCITSFACFPLPQSRMNHVEQRSTSPNEIRAYPKRPLHFRSI